VQKECPLWANSGLMHCSNQHPIRLLRRRRKDLRGHVEAKFAGCGPARAAPLGERTLPDPFNQLPLMIARAKIRRANQDKNPYCREHSESNTECGHLLTP